MLQYNLFFTHPPLFFYGDFMYIFELICFKLLRKSGKLV